MLEALLATLAVAAALAVLLYLGSLLFSAAHGPLTTIFERQRFERHVMRARRSDELLRAQNLDAALHEIRGAFYLYSVHNRSLASAVANHHTGLLSRLIAITAEQQGGGVRLLSLAKTDRLLTERSELQRRDFAARQGSPDERRRDIQRRLEANSRELEAALRQLISEVRGNKRPPVYQ